MSEARQVPVVMCLSGNDPTGGAGIQADIEAVLSMGAHPAPVITALTVQDSVNVKRFEAISPGLLVEQARAVLEDMPVAAFKLGMLGSVENVEAVHTLLRDYPDAPVVLDPILRAGGGTSLASEEMAAAMAELLFPQTTLLTPNGDEARILAHEADTLDACAQELMEMGCEWVLISGGHEKEEELINRLYTHHRKVESFHWQRLAHSYHGSGCTLAASCAGLLAQGLEPFTAIHEAQEYTFEALKAGYRPGMGQHLPNRLFWAREEQE